MKRRDMLQSAGALALVSASQAQTSVRMRRVRPGDAAWPSAAAWATLSRAVGGQLTKVQWPPAVCMSGSDTTACADVFKELKNPYYINPSPGLTQTCGWADAWTSTPSAYAVAARKTADVVAAVNFAREHNAAVVRQASINPRRSPFATASARVVASSLANTASR